MITLQRVIGQVLRDPGSFAMLRSALSSSLAVANPFHRQVIEFAGTHWDAYQCLPKSGDWEMWTSGMEEPQKSGVVQTLSEVLNQPEEDWTPEFIVVEVAKLLKDVATRAAVARLGTMMPNVPPDAFSVLTEEIRKIEPVSILGLKNLAEVGRYINSVHDDEVIVPTGIATLDRMIGGFKSELVFIMADSGIGKTTSLLNFGTAACLHGATVLHLTFEVAAEPLLRRYYRRITESTSPDLRDHPEVVMDKMTHWLKYAKGSVHVLFRPAYETTAEDLEAIVDQFIHLHGKLDVLVLDYLDLLKPPQGFRSEYEGLGRLSHLCRNIGVQRGASVLSATQAGRQAHQARHLRIDMISDSYRKVQAADIILGLVQTPEEYDAGQARLALLKVRENPGRGMEIPLFVNLDLMLIADLDSPNSQRLIAKYKQSPVSVFQR